MKIELEYMNINRFKGLAHYYLELNGQSAVIRSKNGQGKTTLIDALHWLFTGHDSDHKTKFGVLEIDERGETVPKKDASVSAGFLFSDQETGQTGRFEIKREYAQKWTKKRGQAKAELTNHTTRFFWDEIPVSKKDFEARLLQIARIDQINCLIDTDYFCGKMKPGDRRKILMEMINIDSFDLEKPELLKKYTMDEAKKVLSRRKKALNKSLEILPNRIDELKGMLPSMGPGKTEEDLKEIDLEISTIKNKLEKYRSGILAAKESSNLRTVEKALKELSYTVSDEYNQKMINIDDELFSIRVRLRKIESKKIDLERDKRNLTRDMNVNEARRKTLREDWKIEKSRVFTPDTKCYACGQAIPDADIKKQEETFLQGQTEKIQKINEKGQDLYKKYAEMEKRAGEYEKKITECAQDVTSFNTQIENLTGIVAKIKTEKEADEKRRSKDLLDQKAALEKAITMMEQQNFSAIAKEEKRLHELFYQKKELSQSIKDQIGYKIEEREKEMTAAAVEYENVESDLMAIESYGMKRSEIIEKEVNKKFNLIKWKLFEHQINGGIKEICEPMVNGVLYNIDLNTGAKINAGLDAIKSLSRFFELQFPIMIDNAESVTTWGSFEGQTVKMVADEKEDGLTVLLE